MKKLLLLSAVALMLAGCASDTGEQTQTDTDVLKIGIIAPISGDAAVYGSLVQETAQLRADQINAAGGVQGKQIEFIVEDGKCTAADAARAAQKLIGVDGVHVIVGGACSGETLGAAPITERSNVILLSGMSTNPDISHAGDYVFRTAPNDLVQSQVLNEYVQGTEWDKIGILYEQSDYPLAVKREFVSGFDGDVMEESFLPEEGDFKTRITKFKNSDIDALLLIPHTPAKAEVILRQLTEQDWQRPIIANEMFSADEGLVTQYAEQFEQWEMVSANFLAPDNEDFNTFVAAYTEKYQHEPVYPNYAATMVDAVDALVAALESVDDMTDTDAIRDALYATDIVSMHPVRFDENGDAITIKHLLLEMKDGAFVPRETASTTESE